MVKKYNVVSAREYTKNNETKTQWLNVGMMTEFENGNKILELNILPNQSFQIFPLEKKEGVKAPEKKEEKEAYPL